VAQTKFAGVKCERCELLIGVLGPEIDFWMRFNFFCRILDVGGVNWRLEFEVLKWYCEILEVGSARFVFRV
jgi:hypothetical protein